MSVIGWAIVIVGLPFSFGKGIPEFVGALFWGSAIVMMYFCSWEEYRK